MVKGVNQKMKPAVVFWYEFASSYSYLSAMRIAEVAARGAVDVTWKPFLLGPIFKSQGWETSPFNLYPAKGRYMIRDIERIATARGLAFRMPATFPGNGLKAARLAIAAKPLGATGAFSREVFAAAFGRGLDLSRGRLGGLSRGRRGRSRCRAGAGRRSRGESRVAGQYGCRASARNFRCAELHDKRWGAVLGRRSARSGAGVGEGARARKIVRHFTRYYGSAMSTLRDCIPTCSQFRSARDS